MICHAIGFADHFEGNSKAISFLFDVDHKYSDMLMSRCHVITEGWDSYVGQDLDDEGRAAIQYDLDSVKLLMSSSSDVYLLCPPSYHIVKTFADIYKNVAVFLSPGTDSKILQECSTSPYIGQHQIKSLLFMKYHFMNTVKYKQILGDSDNDVDIIADADIPQISMTKGTKLSDYIKRLSNNAS